MKRMRFQNTNASADFEYFFSCDHPYIYSMYILFTIIQPISTNMISITQYHHILNIKLLFMTWEILKNKQYKYIIQVT